MKERPILFSGPMVRAILNGRKTMTRRVVKPQPNFPFGCNRIVLEPDPWHNDAFEGTAADGMGNQGQRQLVWYCEDYAGNLVAQWSPKRPFAMPGDVLWVRETHYREGVGCDVIYRADPDAERDLDPAFTGCAWIPSIFMPRWASRITLEVINVRVERLQDISEADAKAEGVAMHGDDNAEHAFAQLWSEINGADSWTANPWVWVVEFRKLEGGQR